eukprot:TRINITY_DN1704_c3_g1_i3.p1 TRINITY_DN1704_c3_g1~~TRINITY_DN1704_c3_g1_i3.p1  ORF type:complete len:950 (-),score=190.05 TRINITY_DN1704_c3_g1_i3:70-2919(-)
MLDTNAKSDFLARLGNGPQPSQSQQQQPPQQQQQQQPQLQRKGPPGSQPVVQARATHNYQAEDDGELGFQLNSIITVLIQDSSGWWKGQGATGEVGWFPANFVQILPASSIPPPATQQPAASSQQKQAFTPIVGAQPTQQQSPSVPVARPNQRRAPPQKALSTTDGGHVDLNQISNRSDDNKFDKFSKFMNKAAVKTSASATSLLAPKKSTSGTALSPRGGGGGGSGGGGGGGAPAFAPKPAATRPSVPPVNTAAISRSLDSAQPKTSRLATPKRTGGQSGRRLPTRKGRSRAAAKKPASSTPAASHYAADKPSPASSSSSSSYVPPTQQKPVHQPSFNKKPPPPAAAKPPTPSAAKPPTPTTNKPMVKSPRFPGAAPPVGGAPIASPPGSGIRQGSGPVSPQGSVIKSPHGSAIRPGPSGRPGAPVRNAPVDKQSAGLAPPRHNPLDKQNTAPAGMVRNRSRSQDGNDQAQQQPSASGGPFGPHVLKKRGSRIGGGGAAGAGAAAGGGGADKQKVEFSSRAGANKDPAPPSRGGGSAIGGGGAKPPIVRSRSHTAHPTGGATSAPVQAGSGPVRGGGPPGGGAPATGAQSGGADVRHSTPPTIVKSAAVGNMPNWPSSLPPFQQFCKDLTAMVAKVKNFKRGQLSTLIPQLGKTKQEYFGVSVCTVDGQLFSCGDGAPASAPQSATHQVPKPLFASLQGCAFPFLHGMCREKVGPSLDQQFANEPFTSQEYASMTMGGGDKPHNPQCNAGALVVCSNVIHTCATSCDSERIQLFLDSFGGFAGDRLACSMSTYLSANNPSNFNFPVAFWLRGKGKLNGNVEAQDLLCTFNQLTSIEVNSAQLATMGATLANKGTCPITQKQCFKPDTAAIVVDQMKNYGLNSFSAQFRQMMGEHVAAKSGLSGTFMLVIPGIMSIGIISPPIDEYTNSARGIELTRLLVQQYKQFKCE